MSLIRVLHLQGPSNWGGNLEGIRTLFRALDRDRFAPVMGGARSSGYLERFEAEGFETVDIPLGGRWDLRGLHCLNQVLRKREIHLIHSHVRLTDWLGGMASRWIGIPCVSTLHAPFQYTNDLKPLRNGTVPVYGWVLRNLVDEVITVSQALRDDAIRLLKIAPHRITHVVNGVDPEWSGSTKDCKVVRQELGIPLDCPVILQVGWFGHRKGQMDLICAMPKVLEAFPKVQCVFVGEGNLLSSCHDKVQELGLADSVRFLGFRNDVRDLMNAADIVVLPSYCEGLPRVLLEAGLMSRPVVSTKMDGIEELVVDGETGCLVEAGDRNGLAEAIIRMLKDPERAKAMGEKGRHRVLAEFSSAVMARGTEDVYCRVLAKRRISVSKPVSA